MSIESTCRELLLTDFIKHKLQSGNLVTYNDINIDFANEIRDLDLSKSQFDAQKWLVTPYSESSASQFNATFTEMQRDMKVLYTEMLNMSANAHATFERWTLEASFLEKRLIDLEDRIENLLLLTKGTEGYHSVIGDNFTDFFNVDKDNTTALVDIKEGEVRLKTDGETYSRIFTNDIPEQNISFRVYQTSDYIGQVTMARSKLKNLFDQTDLYWWIDVLTKTTNPVTGELVIKFDEVISLSKISLDFQGSSSAGPVRVTPLYSLDNASYSNVPGSVQEQYTKSSASFSFPEIEVKWIKFILTKEAPDSISRSTQYHFEFGFKEITFFAQSFATTDLSSDAQVMISEPRYETDQNGDAIKFEKLTLETCEQIDEGTSLDYFVATSDNPSVPLASAVWIPVTPINRSTSEAPPSVVVASPSIVETLAGISYDPNGTPGNINPAQDFNILSRDASNNIVSTIYSQSDSRYSFANQVDRLLDTQVRLKDFGTELGIEINPFSVEIFRNVGEASLDPNSESSLVRGQLRGWTFEDPWYKTIIQVLNPNGLKIDRFRGQSIIIDGSFGNGIISGRTSTNSGIHSVAIHKSQWSHIKPKAQTLDELKARDAFYPHNSRAIIEGYDYGPNFPEEQKPYFGVDIFAEMRMKQLSVFEFTESLESSLLYFARTKDLPGTRTGDPDPTEAYTVKVDESSSDFMNEKFLIRFNQLNQMHSYLRFKAELMTHDTDRTPVLKAYKIKLG